MSDPHWVDPITGLTLVTVPGGCFPMGDTFGTGFANELPVHEVCLDPFQLATTPVTQGQWREVMGGNPSHFQLGDDHPVEMVSWHDAQTFIERLNALGEGGFRLPTEAEWEYAARSGGKNEKWPGTNAEADTPLIGWYDETGGGATHPVGQLRPNGLGLYDMGGNVFELVADHYAEEAYRHHARHNPCHRTREADDVVIRGGAWYSYKTLMRCSDRSIYAPHWRDRYVGFRLARTLP